MRNMWYIARREYRSFFASPIAYAVIFLILLVLGLVFWVEISYAIQTQQFVPDFRDILQWLVFPLLFLTAPAITMRLVAEENRQGTLELLLTAPVRDWELVVGKWLGSFFFFLTVIAITWIYPLVLNQLVKPGIDQGALLAAYIGVILFAAALCGVGVFISSLFSNQLAALIVSLLFVLLLWIISFPAQVMTGLGGDILRYLSAIDHFSNTFLTGVIDVKDIVYFLSLTALGLFLGTVSVESRRWR
jgi:ABC-2 type transport system permease protein